MGVVLVAGTPARSRRSLSRGESLQRRQPGIVEQERLRAVRRPARHPAPAASGDGGAAHARPRLQPPRVSESRPSPTARDAVDGHELRPATSSSPGDFISCFSASSSAGPLPAGDQRRLRKAVSIACPTKQYFTRERSFATLRLYPMTEVELIASLPGGSMPIVFCPSCGLTARRRAQSSSKFVYCACGFKIDVIRLLKPGSDSARRPTAKPRSRPIDPEHRPKLGDEARAKILEEREKAAARARRATVKPIPRERRLEMKAKSLESRRAAAEQSRLRYEAEAASRRTAVGRGKARTEKRCGRCGQYAPVTSAGSLVAHRSPVGFNWCRGDEQGTNSVRTGRQGRIWIVSGGLPGLGKGR